MVAHQISEKHTYVHCVYLFNKDMNTKEILYQSIPSKDHHWDNASCQPQFPCWLLFWNHESGWTSLVQQSMIQTKTRQAISLLFPH